MPSETDKYESETTQALGIFWEILTTNTQRRNQQPKAKPRKSNYRNKKIRIKLTLNHPLNNKQKPVLDILPFHNWFK